MEKVARRHDNALAYLAVVQTRKETHQLATHPHQRMRQRIPQQHQQLDYNILLFLHFNFNLNFNVNFRYNYYCPLTSLNFP